MELPSTVNQEDFKNLFTDFAPFGLVTTERPETQGLVFRVENKAVEVQVQSAEPEPYLPELENSSGSTSTENVTPKPTASDRKRVRGQDKSEASVALAQSRREARLVNEEKRIAALNQARLELEVAKMTAVNLKNNNVTVTAEINATLKEIDELTKENTNLAKTVEDLIHELTKEYPASMDGSPHPETLKLIEFCNSILERQD